MRQRHRQDGCGPLRDGMTVTYTDIRETLAEIARAHKTTKAKRDRRVVRAFVSRSKGAR